MRNIQIFRDQEINLAQNPLTKLKNKFGNIPVPVNVYTHHGPYALRR